MRLQSLSSSTQTERIYYKDSYVRSFQARVVASDSGHVCLDRTAFYPASGGQPFDIGTLGGLRVLDVINDEGTVWHQVDGQIHGEVEGEIDWTRRFDHMQQHTGQHLLSAVILEEFGWETLSFHMGAEVSTIELAAPALNLEQLERIELRVNAVLAENRSVSIRFEDADTVSGLRKASMRTGVLRLIEIAGLDRSACGGTHVKSTGEIGCILLREVEKVRGHSRVSFVCGGRAVARARRDQNGLAAASRIFSAQVDDVAASAARQVERLQEAEKRARRAETEVASYRGAELYRNTAANQSGLRVYFSQPESLDDAVRQEAQSFTSGSLGVFVAVSRSAPAVLLAVAADAGIHAGTVLKEALIAQGGRGGGAPLLAQGSAPSSDAAQAVAASILNKAGYCG